jgi:hypothetical protein
MKQNSTFKYSPAAAVFEADMNHVFCRRIKQERGQSQETFTIGGTRLFYEPVGPAPLIPVDRHRRKCL